MKAVALITGAALRIGAEISQTLHEAGFTIAIHYRNSKAPAEALMQTLNNKRPNSAAIFQADLNSTAQVQQMAADVVSHFGQVDLLVNNASSFYPTAIGSISEDNWNDLFNSNVKGAFFLSQALVPTLQQHLGSIINIVDIHAERPLKNYSVYCMAKAALAMMTKSLAKELGPQVRVNGVSPGAIIWPEHGDFSEQEKNLILDRVALQRSGKPNDIATTVKFLACDAPYITGQIIAVDGGRSLTN